jgi:phosphomevalonate kinase
LLICTSAFVDNWQTQIHSIYGSIIKRRYFEGKNLNAKSEQMGAVDFFQNLLNKHV